MSLKNRILLFFFFLPLALFAEPLKSSEIVLRHGHIYTMDAEIQWAESIAIGNGRILYIGKDSGVQTLIGPNTRVIDLKNRFVLPSFIDSHVHPASSGI